MRGPTAEEILQAQPHDLRTNTKTAQAYLDLRRKILTGTYPAYHLLTPKSLDEEYKTSNTSSQIVLLRLAGEGLIKIQPIKERTGPNNAAINEYRVADLNIRQRMFSTRQSGFTSDISQQSNHAHTETKTLKIQYADAEIASLLGIAEGENIVFHRTYQYRDSDTLVAIADSYLPFWFAQVFPELEKRDCSIYQLMRKIGKEPFWCTETVDVVQSTSFEREVFGLSLDDPSALLKILRRVFDKEGNPLSVDFLTDRGDIYRLHYSFPLFREGIPQTLREKH